MQRRPGGWPGGRNKPEVHWTVVEACQVRGRELEATRPRTGLEGHPQETQGALGRKAKQEGHVKAPKCP